MTLRVARESGRLVDWLTRDLGIDLHLVDNFLYPGHSRHRIHAPASTKGVQLVNQLLKAVAGRDNIDIAYGAAAKRLIARPEDRCVLGAEIDIKGVGLNLARAGRTILALNGFGANREMVGRYIPAMEKCPLLRPRRQYPAKAFCGGRPWARLWNTWAPIRPTVRWPTLRARF